MIYGTIYNETILNKIVRTSMKRYFFFVFFIICTALFAVTPYENLEYGIHFNVPDHWTVVEHQNGRVIDLIHESKTATINITTYAFEKPVTANGLQEMRAVGRYDGWMNMFERPGTVKENKKANADESYIAVYSKHGLADEKTLKLEEFIVGEYYYVKDSAAVVVSVQTQHSFWKIIQGSLRIVVDSFWMGKEREGWVDKRPEKVRHEVWSSQGEHLKNQNFFSRTTTWNATMDRLLTTSFGDVSPNEFVAPVFYGEDVVTPVDHRLFSMALPSGNMNWSYSLRGDIIHDLSVGKDIIALVTSENGSVLYSVIPENGFLLFEQEIDPLLTAPVVVSDNIILVSERAISVIDGVTGEERWRSRGKYDASVQLLFMGESLLLNEGNRSLESRDIQTGRRRWDQSFRESLFLEPVISSKNIILGQRPKSEDEPDRLLAIHAYSGEQMWDFVLDEARFVGSSFIAASDDVICFLVEVEDRLEVMSLDTKKGKMLWRSPFETIPPAKPLLTNRFVIFQQDGFFVTFDNLTGEKSFLSIQDHDEFDYFFVTTKGIVTFFRGETYDVSLYR